MTLKITINPTTFQVQSGGGGGPFTTYNLPFNAVSIWNRYVDPTYGGGPVLGTNGITIGLHGGDVTPNEYYPSLGPWGISQAQMSDSAQNFTSSTDATTPIGLNAIAGVSAAGLPLSITVPHFPAVAYIAEYGGDSVINIYDDISTSPGTMCDFYASSNPGGNGVNGSGGTWETQGVSWAFLEDYTPIVPGEGTGWWGGGSGVPCNVLAGTTAMGTPTCAGILRNWEWTAANGGNLNAIQHALQIAMGYEGAVSGPMYPSTTEDEPGYLVYGGFNLPQWSIGTFLMLPASFDTTGFDDVSLALVNCLQKYGCYVNNTVGPSYTVQFYVEELDPTGPGDDTTEGLWGDWLGTSAADSLETIYPALRPVTSIGRWLDAHGNPLPAYLQQQPNVLIGNQYQNGNEIGSGLTPPQTCFANMNLLQFRGPFGWSGASQVGTYDPHLNFYIAPSSGSASTTYQWHYETDYSDPWWVTFLIDPGGVPEWFCVPAQGSNYNLSSYGSGDITFTLNVYGGVSGSLYISVGPVSPGSSANFNWPTLAGTDTYFATEYIWNIGTGGGMLRPELVLS